MEPPLDAYFDGFTRRDWQTLDPDAVEDPVRIAVVGLGWFSREWALPGIRRSAFTEATVGVDVDPDAVETVADEHGLVGLRPEAFEEGAAAGEYDAVYVATPNATHLDYVAAAADRGKAILCEKPLEATVERGERLVDACEDAGVPLMVGYRMQTEPAVRRAKELLEAGFLGDVVHVHANMSQTMLGEVGTDADQWRLDPERSGGCALMDIGIYPLNTTRFLLEADPERVYGHVRSEHEAFAGVDEHAAFRLEFPGDVHALCTVSQNAQHASRLEITGTEGQLVLDPAFYEREDRGLRVVRGGVGRRVRAGPPARGGVRLLRPPAARRRGDPPRRATRPDRPARAGRRLPVRRGRRAGAGLRAATADDPGAGGGQGGPGPEGGSARALTARCRRTPRRR